MLRNSDRRQLVLSTRNEHLPLTPDLLRGMRLAIAWVPCAVRAHGDDND